MRKEYCVHVWEQQHDYEGIMAKSPQEAEAIVIKREWAGDYENIYQVEVMRTCKCGLDNENTNKKCEDCGAKL